jgi:NADH dehydrogenase
VRIAVTGATGFVGRNLVNRLLDEKHEITVLTHRRSGELFGNNVRAVQGSVDRVSEMVAAFRGADLVFHLVGILTETRENTFEKTVAQGTENVVGACEEARVNRIVYLSALGTSAHAETAYHKTKYHAEQSVQKSKLQWTIFRASIIYGKNDGFLTTMSKVIRYLPFVPIFGDGHYKIQPIFIADLCEVMVGTLSIPSSFNQIIDIGGPEQLDYKTAIELLKKAMGKRRVNFHIPFGVIMPVAGLLQTILKPAPLTIDMLKMLKMGNTGDISRMRAIFGIEPIKFEQGLNHVFGVN